MRLLNRLNDWKRGPTACGRRLEPLEWRLGDGANSVAEAVRDFPHDLLRNGVELGRGGGGGGGPRLVGGRGDGRGSTRELAGTRTCTIERIMQTT